MAFNAEWPPMVVVVVRGKNQTDYHQKTLTYNTGKTGRTKSHIPPWSALITQIPNSRQLACTSMSTTHKKNILVIANQKQKFLKLNSLSHPIDVE